MRKLSGMLLMMLFALVLAACGGEDEETDPLEDATEPAAIMETVEPEPTEEVTEEEVATPEEMTAEDEAATPDEMAVDEDATPTSAVVPMDEATGATPNVVSTPVSAATPVVDAAAPDMVATPVVDASPEATPLGAALTPPTPADGAEDGEPTTIIPLSGRVVLRGSENEAYIRANDGCIGLGQHSDMRVGRQVVVRDESGTIVGVTTLEAAETEGCAWSFSLEVPESEFYSVAVPMKTEMVFTQEDVSEGNGDLEVPLM